MAVKPRIKLDKKEAKKGDLVEVKALVSHIMESGQRRDGAGNVVPRKILNKFACTVNGKQVFAADFEPAISANPYIQFKFRAEESGPVVLTWTDDDGSEHRTIGLKGHVLGPAFPEGYSNWQKTDLHDLIDAELIKEPTDKNVVKAIKKVAKEADELVIATDFDREGELIGLEALEEMLDANPDPTEQEIRTAISGAICRCTGYKNIVAAVRWAADHEASTRQEA